MNKIWLLTKIQLKGSLDFSKNFSGKKKNRSKAFVYGMGAFIILLFIALSVFYNITLGFAFREFGILELLPAMMLALSCILVLFTTIHNAKGTIYGFLDYDMVMSLPVKTSDIVTSRVILLYILNLGVTAIILLPAHIVYGVFSKPNPIFYMISTILIFFVPMIPIIIATMIGLVIALFSARFKHSNIISLVVTVVLMAGVLIASFSLGSFQSSDDFGNLKDMFLSSINGIYPLAGMYQKAICDYDIVQILLFVSISLVAFLIYRSVLGRYFKSINSIISSVRVKSNYKLKEMKTSSALKALLRKEAKRYFSSVLYVMNTGVGVVMLTLLTIALAFLGKEKLAVYLEMPMIADQIGYYLPIMISFCIGIDCTTGISISLEGKNLWILKSSPIAPKTIFHSKILLNLLVTVPFIIINAIILGIITKASLLGYLSMLILPNCIVFFTAITGLIIGLKFPNFSWTSETQVIKQSVASMFSVFTGMIVSMLPIGLLILFKDVNPYMIYIAFSVILAIITYGLYQYLITKGKAIFERF